MPYADQQDLERLFGSAELLIAADRDGDGEADPGVIRAALDAATAEMDSYIGVKYTLPLSLTQKPVVLVDTCCDIAMYRMSIDSPAMTDAKRQRYDDRIKWLRDLAREVVTLGRQESTETADDLTVQTDSSEVRLFSRTKMSGLL